MRSMIAAAAKRIDLVLGIQLPSKRFSPATRSAFRLAIDEAASCLAQVTHLRRNVLRNK